MSGIMQFEFAPTNQFKRDAKKQWQELLSLDWITVVYCLMNGMALPEKYRDYELKHNWQGFRECHIKPDLLLIYRKNGDLVELVRLGSHSELFE